MKRFAFVCLAVVLCVPEFAHAQRLFAMKAGKFAQICSSHSGRGVCEAYLDGIADGESLSIWLPIIMAIKVLLKGFVSLQQKKQLKCVIKCLRGLITIKIF